MKRETLEGSFSGGLVLSCIDADFYKKITAEKLLTRSTRSTHNYIEVVQFSHSPLYYLYLAIQLPAQPATQLAGCTSLRASSLIDATQRMNRALVASRRACVASWAARILQPAEGASLKEGKIKKKRKNVSRKGFCMMISASPHASLRAREADLVE